VAAIRTARAPKHAAGADTATPPLVCIEILSPEDGWPRVERRIEDFLSMGVQRIWVFEVLEDLLEAPRVSVRISEPMAELH
jgi:Uma2 family endonuclease